MPKERYERLNELLYFSATKWHTVLSIRLGSLEITISSPISPFFLVCDSVRRLPLFVVLDLFQAGKKSDVNNYYLNFMFLFM